MTHSISFDLFLENSLNQLSILRNYVHFVNNRSTSVSSSLKGISDTKEAFQSIASRALEMNRFLRSGLGPC